MSDESSTVMITGASSGIGAAFARRFAERGYRLVLVARRRERLERLAQEIQERRSAAAEVLVADLSIPADVQRLEERIEAIPVLEVLVNNAGFGTRGHFCRTDLARQLDMIHVHVVASVRLTRAALPQMIARRSGSIINVSSMSAFLPMPNSVTYSATKAYLVTFSKGLAKELTGTGVHVQALCPGFTYTEFHDTPEFRDFHRSQISRSLWMSADDVVTESIRAIRKNRPVCIPGRKNRLFLTLIRSPLGPLLVRALARKRWE